MYEYVFGGFVEDKTKNVIYNSINQMTIESAMFFIYSTLILIGQTKYPKIPKFIASLLICIYSIKRTFLKSIRLMLFSF